MGWLSRVSEFMRGPRAIIGSRHHMPGPLPQTVIDHPWHYIDPPTPPDFHVKDFGMLNYPKSIFIDRFGATGTYDQCKRLLTDSKGETMSLWDFMALPNRRRRWEYDKFS